MTTTTDRNELKKEADALVSNAKTATDVATRNAYLAEAAPLYRKAGFIGLAMWCERHLG